MESSCSCQRWGLWFGKLVSSVLIKPGYLYHSILFTCKFSNIFAHSYRVHFYLNHLLPLYFLQQFLLLLLFSSFCHKIVSALKLPKTLSIQSLSFQLLKHLGMKGMMCVTFTWFQKIVCNIQNDAANVIKC